MLCLIIAAGHGSRLRSLAPSKPLAPVAGVPLIEHVVRRAAAGLGARLLAWTGTAVRERGRGLLRLDCPADNTPLRAYYDRAGFRHVGDLELPGAATLWSPPRTMLSLYDRQV